MLVLPHAGGSRAAFTAFHPAAHVLDYPGHGADFADSPLATCAALADWAGAAQSASSPGLRIGCVAEASGTCCLGASARRRLSRS